MKILHVALKHAISRFRICNYFREIFRFSDFMSTLRNFAKFVLLIFSRNLNISPNNLYSGGQFYPSKIVVGGGGTPHHLDLLFCKSTYKINISHHKEGTECF